MDVSDQEICCHFSPIDKVEPGDSSAPCRMFSIEVSASFLSPTGEFSDFEEDESALYDSDCLIVDQLFLIEQEKLLAEETSAATVRGILEDMNVPVQSNLVDRILEFFRQIGNNRHYRDRKVVRVMVEIEVPQAMDDGGGGGTGISVERLEEIRMETAARCAICWEELGVGMEARRMPECVHLYHTHCILNWLEKGSCCPLCRSSI